MEKIKLNIESALLYLLSEKYVSEFKVVEGLSRHPDFINFYQWLERDKLISEDELKRITEVINAKESDVWELVDMARENINLTVHQKEILINETQDYEGCESKEYYNKLSDKKLANAFLNLFQ